MKLAINLNVLAIPVLLLAGQSDAGAPLPPPSPDPAAMAALGKLLFNDPNLSASNKQSCASCHAPQNAMLAPNTLSVQLGGAELNLQGLRNVPSAAYALFTPPPKINNQGKLKGGVMLDGRSASLATQAQLPFLAANEMANASSTVVKIKLLGRPYFAQYLALFGSASLNNPDITLTNMAQAIALYEQTDPAFRLFSSKFDAFLAGKAQLSTAETNGMNLFNNPGKGNCAACHDSTSHNGIPPLFTDYSFHANGVPRNWKITYNLDSTILPDFLPQNGLSLGAPNHQFYDLGACGPLRTDQSGNTSTCGQFKVPSLRNTALKGAYEHNGVFSSLQQVLSFYNNRDLTPAVFYKKADGITPDIPYNDLPVAYQLNIDNPPPFHLLPGKQAVLQPSEINAIIIFLCTLTDGYNPSNPSAYPYPKQCSNAN